MLGIRVSSRGFLWWRGGGGWEQRALQAGFVKEADVGRTCASDGLEDAMRKIIFWATVISGIGAAYLMFKRGASMQEIAQKAVGNPVGALVDEVKAAV